MERSRISEISRLIMYTSGDLRTSGHLRTSGDACFNADVKTFEDTYINGIVTSKINEV